MNEKLVWDDLRVFLAVARSNTISGAASQLGLGIATVSRRIERLEAAIGQPLFQRHQTGYQLTEEAAALVGRAEEIESAAQALTSDARDLSEIHGTVRLATAETFATHLIAPNLGVLRESYPELSLEIVTGVSTVNLHRRDADLALRMVKPERGNLSMQRIGTLGFGLYCSHSYVQARTHLAVEDTKSTDDFICWGEGFSNLPAARWLTQKLRGRRPSLVSSSIASHYAACFAGLGLAVLPHFLASPHLYCVQADLGADQDIWLVTHSDLVQSRRVKVVADFCRELITQNRAALSGPERS